MPKTVQASVDSAITAPRELGVVCLTGLLLHALGTGAGEVLN